MPKHAGILQIRRPLSVVISYSYLYKLRSFFVLSVICTSADAPSAVRDYLLANFKPDPLAPLATPVVLTGANFGKIEKVYIHTINDHAVSYSLQQRMVNGSNVARVYALPSSHTPFISMPAVLAAILLRVAK